MLWTVTEAQGEAAARAAKAADELAASIRGLQMAGFSKRMIGLTLGLNRFTVNALLTQWGLNT